MFYRDTWIMWTCRLSKNWEIREKLSKLSKLSKNFVIGWDHLTECCNVAIFPSIVPQPLWCNTPFPSAVHEMVLLALSTTQPFVFRAIPLCIVLALPPLAFLYPFFAHNQPLSLDTVFCQCDVCVNASLLPGKPPSLPMYPENCFTTRSCHKHFQAFLPALDMLFLTDDVPNWRERWLAIQDFLSNDDSAKLSFHIKFCGWR